MGEFYDTNPAPLIERLARIEGQSNFLSLLAGVEAGPDTTQDMGALAISRGRGAIPEVLEAHVAQSAMYRLPLMSVVWHAIRRQVRPKQKDWPWMQGAIADAFLMLRTGHCNPVKDRAKQFKVDHDVYGAIRKTASGVFSEILGRAEAEFKGAMRSRRNPTRKPDTAGEKGQLSYVPAWAATMGHSRSGVRPYDPEDDPADRADYGGRSPGMTDRLGWDDRNAAPSPVKLAQPTTSGDSSENEAEP